MLLATPLSQKTTLSTSSSILIVEDGNCLKTAGIVCQTFRSQKPLAS